LALFDADRHLRGRPGRLQPARRRGLHQAECAPSAAAPARPGDGRGFVQGRQALTFGLPYIHSAFDVAAWLASVAVFWFGSRRLVPAAALPANRVEQPGLYALAAGAGAVCGALFFGTLNVWLAGIRGLGFSMAGGIAGAIASIELFKHLTGVRG